MVSNWNVFLDIKSGHLTTEKGMSALHDPVFLINSIQFLIGIIIQFISLALIFVIPIFKPWGLRIKKNQLIDDFK